MNNKVTGIVNNVHYTFKGFKLFNYIYTISNGSIIKDVSIPFFKREEFLNNPEKWI